MIFSKCVKIFWLLATVCSLCSFVMCSWLFFSILSESDFDGEFKELYAFQLSLMWGSAVEIFASLFSFATTTFFHCCNTSYTLQRRIPFWIFLNVLFLYSSIGAVLFPYLKQIKYTSRVHLDHQKQLKEENAAVVTSLTTERTNFESDDLKLELVFSDEHLIHMYYGLLCGKAMVLVGFITTLYSYLSDLKRMNGLLHNLQFQHLQEDHSKFFVVHDKKRKSQIL